MLQGIKKATIEELEKAAMSKIFTPGNVEQVKRNSQALQDISRVTKKKNMIPEGRDLLI